MFAPATTEPVDLSYYFPFCGNLTTRLEGDAAAVYRFLESAGEIARLKDLDHLGLIREAYEAAHHSRWEYVILTMCLLDRVRRNEESHLESEVELTDNDSVDSGLNLLKIWSMLANIGHLPWTFASERAFVELMQSNEEYAKAFRNCFDESLHKPIDDRIKRLRIHNYHEFLSYLRLRSIGTKADEPLRRSCKHVVAKFILREYKPSFMRLNHIFRRVRQIAYLGLDSFHTPTPIKLDMGHLLSDSDWLGKFILPTLLSEQADLSAIDLFYSNNLYCSRRSLAAVAARDEQLRQAMAQRAKTLAAEESQQWVYKFVEELAQGEIQRHIEKRNITPVVRLWISSKTVSEMKTRAPEGILELQWPEPSGPHQMVQLHVLKGQEDHAPAALLRGFELAESMYQRISMESWQENQELQNINERNATELIEAALHILLPKAQWWEWKTVGPEKMAFVGWSHDACKILSSMRHDEKSRFIEVAAMRHLLETAPNQVVVLALKALTAWRYGKKIEPAAEFDGLVLARDGASVQLIMLEAKGNPLDADRAELQLHDQLYNLGGKPDKVKKQFINKKKEGVYAWCAIPLGNGSGV